MRWTTTLRAGVVALAMSIAGCASSRVVSTERLPDVTLSGVKPEQFSRACAAICESMGWRVDRADSSRVDVETPRDAGPSGRSPVPRSAQTTWCEIKFDLSPAADGGCLVSCSISALADGDADDVRRTVLDDRVGGVISAVAVRAKDATPR